MASGVITGNTYESGHYWIELDWTDGIINSTTSSVTVKTYFCSDWATNFTASKDGTTTINGTQQSWTSNTDVNYSNGSVQKTLVWSSQAQSVTHNADGTKSITISGTYTPNITVNGTLIGTMTASGTVALSDTNGTEVIPNLWVASGGTTWVRAKHFYVFDGSSWIHCQSMKACSGGTTWVSTK